jgi:hypothetical protein
MCPGRVAEVQLPSENNEWSTSGTLLPKAMPEPPTAASLIEQAFGLARRSGKPDWWAMTIPVFEEWTAALDEEHIQGS